MSPECVEKGREIAVRPKWFENARRAWSQLMAARRESRRRAGGVEEADKCRRQSNWRGAIAGYKAYLRRNTQDRGVRVRLIRTMIAAGHLDEAEVLLDGVIRARRGKSELTQIASALRSARSASVPVRKYQDFRRGMIIPAPPDGMASASRLTVIINDCMNQPALLDRTLESLQQSQVSPGTVIVQFGGNQLDRVQENKIRASDFVLLLEAGVELAPQAIGWLFHAVATTGAAAAYGDDDHAKEDASTTIWFSPAFHSAPHPIDLATSPRPPAAILFQGSKFPTFPAVCDRRALLLAAFQHGTVAHVPLLLATSWTPESEHATGTGRRPAPPPNDRIRAIIPTRDEGEILLGMIESLESLATQPSRLEVVVVDNGSRDAATLALMDTLSRDGRIRVLTVDEPFNWSRLNNLAAAGCEAEVLLFVNNDMRMITRGWDDRLRSSLLKPGVGVVGARLVYPNGLLQHGGIALGALDGKPVHEGLGATSSEGGPLNRWLRPRPAAAVTGAFMGVRRDVFEQAGGFNASEFAVGCNDIDFCLRVREQGWSIFYAADLELIHLESHSRGHDDDQDRLMRARGELEALFRIWGKDAAHDPGLNPHWINNETQVFHGLRQPDIDRVEAWIRRSVDVWRVIRCQTQLFEANPTLR